MSLTENNFMLAQKAGKATIAAYFTSGSLVLADVLQFLNNNAGAVGACVAMLTLFVNIYYQRKRSKQMSHVVKEEMREIFANRKDEN